MSRFFAMFLMALATVSTVRANLGDSDDKIDDSYGNLVQRHLRDDGTVSMLYHKDRYLCLVIFDRLRSVCETYSRIDGRELSTKEISKFLKANAARAKWIRDDTSSERRFERSDHRAEATYLNLAGRPTLKVRELAKR
jgi:hypothetical protein